MVTRYNEGDVPFVVQFIIGNEDNVVPIMTYYGDEPEVVGETVPWVSENVNIGIYFYSKDNAQDCSGKLILQTSVYDENGEQEKIVVSLEADKTKRWIFRNGFDESFPWRLGFYSFEVQYGGTRYYSGFYVKPIHLTERQVRWVHRYLENKIEGLSLDLLYRAHGVGERTGSLLPGHWAYDYATWIGEVLIDLNRCLQKFERSPIETVYSMEEGSAYPTQISPRNERWQVTGKGVVRNGGWQSQQFHLNKHKRLTMNNIYNKWIMKVLVDWIYDLELVSGVLTSDIRKQKLELNKTDARLTLAIKEQEDLQTRRDLSRSKRDSLIYKIRSTEQKKLELERAISLVEAMHQPVEAVSGRMRFLRSHGAFQGITKGTIKPVLKLFHYNRFDELYELSKRRLQHQGQYREHVAVRKPTWKIFEYFVLFTVLDIIRRYDYELVTDLTPDQLGGILDQGLQSGTCFALENSSSRIEVWYDKSVLLREDAEAQNDSFFSANVIRPDIRLDYYEKRESGLWFLGSCVLDAKLRSFDSLYSRKYTNLVSSQLLNYFSIYFRSSNTSRNNRRQSIVNRIICVYSRDKKHAVREERDPLLFIQLFPEISGTNEDSTDLVGVDELSNELGDWIGSFN